MKIQGRKQNILFVSFNKRNFLQASLLRQRRKQVPIITVILLLFQGRPRNHAFYKTTEKQFIPNSCHFMRKPATMTISRNKTDILDPNIYLPVLILDKHTV